MRDEYLYEKLDNMVNWGVELLLCGRPSTPDEVASLLVKEEAIYMPDFIYDEKGRLSELHYDRINQ